MQCRIMIFLPKLLLNILLISLFSLFCFNSLAEERLLDKVVAIVNSQVITQSEFDQQMKITRAQIQSAGVPMPSADTLHQQVLNQLIDIALQKSIAKKANIVVSDAQVNAAIAKIAAQNHVTVSQLQQGVKSEGMSYSAYRQHIRDQILIAQVQQSLVAPKVKMTPQDITDAKNIPDVTHQTRLSHPSHMQYHLIDILITQPEKAKALLKQLRETHNPGKILNNNPAVNITDLDFRFLSQLPDIFIRPTQSLQPGQFSDLIKAPNGLHILNLVAVKGSEEPPHMPALTLEQKAYQKKYTQVLEQWLQTLRSQSYIKIIK